MLIRFQDDIETAMIYPSKSGSLFNMFSIICGKKMHKKDALIKGKALKERRLSRVFSEDYDIVTKRILDPRGDDLSRWNRCFLVACLVSLFVDPLFFYLPEVKSKMCMGASVPLEQALTVIRSAVDVLYFIQIIVRFHTAYVAPSSRVFGRGELVIDSSKIAQRYLCREFWFDLLAALPLPQVSNCFWQTNI